MNILFDAETQRILQRSIEISKSYNHEYVTPEHLLLGLLENPTFSSTVTLMEGYPDYIETTIKDYLDQQEKVDKLPDEGEEELSVQMEMLLNDCIHTCQNAHRDYITLPIIVQSLMKLDNNFAAKTLVEDIGGESERPYFIANLMDDASNDGLFGENDPNGIAGSKVDNPYLANMNTSPSLTIRPNLVGRDAELQRTMQVLCRYSKNNPLHIGEPGVGKTALVWGLVRLIVEGKVPQPLKDVTVYQLNIGSLLAGSQFRGDMESRLKNTLDQVANEQSIVYIDDIHLIFGASHQNDGNPSAYDIIKPYLEGGMLRVIGTTTYAEYKRNMERSSGLLRHFQKIDIDEPSQEDTFQIAMGQKELLESFHQVTYDEETVRYAVSESTRHITDRFQPDKTLDLLDEAGAMIEMREQPHDAAVSKSDISNVLAKMTKVEALAEHDNDADRLASLYGNITAQIYGQDEAVRLVVEAIQMAKAGLNDDDKPLASLLFVGPTGVGKTEVARVLSQQLGIELIRFDMSEYVEKHTVAKLIGSPAGYVGYEDGGLLTDAIRKNPNSVLLLDEIEKAHEDIYNILLQVMDYARLTDNRGQKADFRNVVLIMTSNAGAQFASQASVGFTGHVKRADAMIKQVKKTFKPEFLNRLTGVVSFNDMDEHMAQLILKKKLGILETKLQGRNITLHVSEQAFAHLLQKGFTKEYGAREIDRVIAREVKPLLMKEILFGKLKNGGPVTLNYTEDDGIRID